MPMDESTSPDDKAAPPSSAGRRLRSFLRLQFSLRSLLLLMLVFAVAFAVYEQRRRYFVRVHQAVQELEEAGAFVFYHGAHSATHRLVEYGLGKSAPNFLQRYYKLSYQIRNKAAPPTRAMLKVNEWRSPAALFYEAGYREYGLSGADDSLDRAMSRIESLSDLEVLAVQSERVTAATLRRIHACRKLKLLYLCVPDLSDDDLAAIGPLPHLEGLALAPNPRIASFHRAENRGGITDAGLRSLGDLSGLRALCLVRTNVDGGFLVGSKFDSLAELSILGRRVTNPAIDAVRSLPALTRLHLCDLDAADVERLAVLKPKLQRFGVYSDGLRYGGGLGGYQVNSTVNPQFQLRYSKSNFERGDVLRGTWDLEDE